jgi:hypothetical protein
MPYDGTSAPSPLSEAVQQDVRALADHLRRIHPSAFNMNSWGTCISAHAFQMYGAEYRARLGRDPNHSAYLDKMFCPDAAVDVGGNVLNPFKATNLQAAKMLDHYAATGEVDWREAFL